jgi:hypothetical protein
VTQQVRNLAVDERLASVRFLIHDRDAKFCGPFYAIVRSEGVRVIETPFRAPRANAGSPPPAVFRRDVLGGLIHEYAAAA